MAVKTFNDGSNLSDADKQTLRKDINCEVVFESEAKPERYNELIHRWNEAYQERANIIVLTESEADVSAAIIFATKHKIDMAVRCGGHSYFGSSSTTGMVIDLRKMNHVSLDKDAKTMTAGGGCLARDLEVSAEENGLVIGFGAVNDTGIGGLTLGGGLGWMTGQYGLALDNLLSARVALANGKVVPASETENPDLFWAIRGGGGNFGIVTQFVFRVYESKGPSFFQMVSFTPDKLDACLSILNTLHTTATEPADGRYAPMFCLMAPPGAPVHLPTFLIFYDGPEAEARAYSNLIYDIGPANTMGGPMPYPEVTDLIHKFEQKGNNRWASSTAYLPWPINIPTIKSAIEDFNATIQKHDPALNHSMLMLDMRDYRKSASVPASSTAYVNRSNMAGLVGEFRYDEAAYDQIAREETRGIAQRVKDKIKEEKVKAGRVQANDDEEVDMFYGNISMGNEKLESLYGGNLPRLKELKRKYDPEGVWNKWFPIPLE